jgi:hypothetical protein
VNGASPNAHLGDTSLDCRPLPVSLIGTLPIDLTSTTGTRTRTLTPASVNCRAAGFTTYECMCDTCNAPGVVPCTQDADCPNPPGPIGPICGGLRCLGGANVGAACTVDGDCPGSSCGRTGAATHPNECDLGPGDCTITSGNEAECAGGPTHLFCEPNATMVACTAFGDADCDAAGLQSCFGGANAGAVCTVASECPGGTCDFDNCTGIQQRECFSDQGVAGGTVTATGVTDAPVLDESDPTLAALFCLGPVSSSLVNAVLGLPGLGRIELGGHARGLP